MEIRRFRRKRERERESAIDRSNFESHMLLIKGVGWPTFPKTDRGIRDKVLRSRNRKARRECCPRDLYAIGQSDPSVPFTVPTTKNNGRSAISTRSQPRVTPSSSAHD